jgi:hypothetical protein
MLQDDIHGIVAEDTLCWDVASGRYIERWEKIEYLLRYPCNERTELAHLSYSPAKWGLLTNAMYVNLH